MHKKNSAKAAAIIEIGSRHIHMDIAEWKKNQINALDTLDHPTSIGYEVFESGKISFQSLRGIIEALNKYSHAVAAYGIQGCKVASSTVLASAENAALVWDQINVHTHMDVRIFEDNEEKSYLYFEVLERLTEQSIALDGYSLLAHIGSGSIGLAVCFADKVIYSQKLAMGALNIYEAFERLRRETENVYASIAEYVQLLLASFHLPKVAFSRIVMVGPDAARIAELTGANKVSELYSIDVQSLSRFQQKLTEPNISEMANRFTISESEAAVLCNAAYIYSGIASLYPEAEKLYYSCFRLSTALMRQTLSPKAEQRYQTFILDSTLAATQQICEYFHYDRNHASLVADHAMRIFDRLKPLHGMDAFAKNYLQIAACLYSCAPFPAFCGEASSTYAIASKLEIFGLTKETMKIIGIVTAASIELPYRMEEERAFQTLPPKNQLLALKLSAIMNIAIALDASRKNKLKNIKISLQEHTLTIRAIADGNALLEKRAFLQAVNAFEVVFGVTPTLSVAQAMLLQN